MIQVWIYDDEKIFIESVLVDEVTENMTTVPITIGYVKPTFNEELQEWYEGATEEEIQKWKDENTVVQEPTEMENMADKISNLEEENKLLNAQVQALNATNDFHEELIAEMAMLVYA